MILGKLRAVLVTVLAAHPAAVRAVLLAVLDPAAVRAVRPAVQDLVVDRAVPAAHPAAAVAPAAVQAQAVHQVLQRQAHLAAQARAAALLGHMQERLPAAIHWMKRRRQQTGRSTHSCF